MIAERVKQMGRGKRREIRQEVRGMGPQKPATDMSATAQTGMLFFFPLFFSSCGSSSFSLSFLAFIAGPYLSLSLSAKV